MSINFTRIRNNAFALAIIRFFFLCTILIFVVVSANFANAASKKQGLSEDRLEEFAQNNILFYDPGDCISSAKFSSVCGSTPREKYWSALRQELDEIHTAAIFGSIVHEGGFGTTRWEIGVNVTGDGGTFKIPWSTLYNDCTYTGRCGGVGSFGITWTLTPYLQQVNKENPDLLKYFQDPTNYSFPGDKTLENIGDTDYSRLVEQEVKYVLNEADMESFKATTTLDEATDWWTENYENCVDCCGGADYDHSCEQIALRRAAAQKEYDEMKDFTCTASSSPKSGSSSVSTNTVSGNDITWIGDSYSVQADNKGLLSGKFPGVDIGPGSNDTSSSYIQGSKFVSSGSSSNPSCLTILQNIIDANKLRPYLVFACGTNGGWSDGDVAKFTEMLKDKDTKAIVVTSKIPRDDYADSNNRLRAMVEANDNIYLADWTSVYNADYFAGDPEKIHPVTDPGYEKWIGIISSALSGASDKGCTTYEGDYPEYLQGDARWGGLDYGGCTMAYCACGASSMAMLATVATGQDIYPNDIADLLGNQYYHSVSVHTLDPIVGEHYGFEVVLDEANSFEETKEKFRKYLKDGYMIHFTGYGCYPGFMHGPGNCSDGHVIGLYDIDENDNVTQANSAYGGNQKSSLDDMANARLWPQFTAIKGNGSSKNTCSDYCSNSKIAINDGLTEDQAKKLAEYYNGPDVDANKYDLPYGKTNCVSFSKWFIEKFTGLKWGGGNGKDVANSLTVENKLTTGTEPNVYAVFSVTSGSTICEDNYPCGHTGIVVAVNGDDVITVEASYPDTPAYVAHHNISYFTNTKYNKAFTYLYDSVDQKELKRIVGN